MCNFMTSLSQLLTTESTGDLKKSKGNILVTFSFYHPYPGLLAPKVKNIDVNFIFHCLEFFIPNLLFIRFHIDQTCVEVEQWLELFSPKLR